MKKLLTFLSIIIGSLCVYGSAFADSVPTITGTRTYSYYGVNNRSDGINGGNPNGIIPFTIIGAPPSGYSFINLDGVSFEFPYSAGNGNQKYNRTTISFLFVQPALSAGTPKTLNKNYIPVMSARKTSDNQLVQTTCNYGSENNDSLVISCEWIHPEYTAFNYFYFAWQGQNGIGAVYSSGVGNTNPISLSVGDIQVVSSSDPLLQGQSTIINQNQQIINQNQQMITGMEVNNQLQQQTYDYLTDTTPPSANTEVLGNAVGWLPPGPVDSILTLPLQLLQGITNVFTGSAACTPLNLPVPFVNYNLQLPCVNILMDEIGFTPIWSIVGGVISAVIIWQTLKWLYEYVDRTLTFRENNSGLWGGL